MRRVLLALPFALLACGGEGAALEGGDTSTDFEEARSSLERATPDEPVDLAGFVAGNTAFAVDLLKQAGPTTANALVSPHSISTTLAMAYAGAAGSTKTDLAHALHFEGPDAALHAAFNWTNRELDARTANGTTVHVQSALFGQSRESFGAGFLDTLAVSYGVGVRLVDFGNPAAATSRIDAWVSQATEARIPQLLTDQLDADTRAVLVNTLYVHAAWAVPFLANATTAAPFQLPTGTVDVPTLNATTDAFSYAHTADGDVVELQTADGKLAFDVILPAGPLAEYEAGLDAVKLGAAFAALAPQSVVLALPKLSLASPKGTSLKEALTTLGMGSAFGPDADFTPMLPGVHLTDVVHQAFLDVDESGLTAAAATAAPAGRKGGLLEPIVTMTVDRPFVIALRDQPTGALLLLGHVVDPR